MFGAILTATLTAQLQQNFVQISQEMPPTVQAVLDPAQFQSSASMAEGAGGEPVNLEVQLVAAAIAPIEQQRSLINAALGGNMDARAQLLSSPETLPEVKAELAATSGSDPAALARASSAINAAEQQVREDAARSAHDVTTAVKLAYTTSVTRIYLFAIPLAGVALLVIAVWLPEIPLSKAQHVETAVGE